MTTITESTKLHSPYERKKRIDQFIMKMPIFKDGIPLNTTNDLYEIELSHAQAVEMAIENVAWQAADTYFYAPLKFG